MRGKFAHELSAAEIRQMAVRYLGRREYGIEELNRKLQQRGAEPEPLEQVMAWLVEHDLISDERFTEMYVRTRMRRLFGPRKISGELRQRGISDYLITRQLQFDPEAWFDTATQWATRRVHGELDFAAKAKIHRSLMTRGFDHEQASTALARAICSDHSGPG